MNRTIKNEPRKTRVKANQRSNARVHAVRATSSRKRTEGQTETEALRQRKRRRVKQKKLWPLEYLVRPSKQPISYRVNCP